jgi:hypothetical protein
MPALHVEADLFQGNNLNSLNQIQGFPEIPFSLTNSTLTH